MPDITTSQVSVNRSSSETLSNGMVLVRKAVSITLPDNGTVVAEKKIPASAFGLSSLEDVSSLVSAIDDEILIPAVVENRMFLVLQSAGANTAASYSGTYNCVVRGY